MESQRILERLKPETFEPFVLVTREGSRYEIRDRTLLKVMKDGTMHVLFPTEQQDAHFEGWTTLSCEDVASIEPVQRAAS